MNQTLDVLLYGARVAALHRDSGGRLRLTYTEQWLRDPETMPVSLSLPLQAAAHTGSKLVAFLDNLLPDSQNVRDRWAVRASLDSADPFSLLGRYGADVAGAIQFVPLGVTAGADTQTKMTDRDIAQRIRGIREDETDWLGPEQHAGHFSLGGAQGKFALGLHRDGWYEPGGGYAATHLFKPRVRGLQDGELIEFMTMRLAVLSELAAAQVYIGEFQNEHCLVVQRFDRFFGEQGYPLRRHQEDLVQALGYPRLKKYESHGGPGYRVVLDLLKQRVPESRRAEALLRFVRALVFSWMLLNTDAHAKNYSVFIDPDGIDLTPLYDVSCLIPYLGHPAEHLQTGVVARYVERMPIRSAQVLAAIRGGVTPR